MISLLVFRLIPVLCYISLNFAAAIPEDIDTKNLPFLDDNVINTNDEFLIQKIDNGTSYLIIPNKNYIPTTKKPPKTEAPKQGQERQSCPVEFDGVPICKGLAGELTQLRNTSCWYTKPFTLDSEMVIVKLVLYSVLVVISYLGNLYIICVGLFDWFLSRQAFCAGLVGLAIADLTIVSWYYSEDILTARFPVDGYYPIEEVGCVCREMFVNITFAVLMFIIVILFHERKHECVVAETKFKLNPDLFHIQRQFSNQSHVSSQAILGNGGLLPPPNFQPPSPPIKVDPYSLEVECANGGGPLGEQQEETSCPPCCMGAKAKTKVMSARQMVSVMVIVLILSFVRGIVFASVLKYSKCAIDDGTMFPTCEPDNLDYSERLGLLVGDACVVFVVPVVLVCYYSKCLFYRLHMPYHQAHLIIGHHDRSKKFILLLVLAMMTFIFLLPERALFIFVKVTKIPFGMSMNVFIRLLVYLNCAFKPLLYGLLYREMYYPLLILVLGMKDARKPVKPSQRSPNHPSMSVDEPEDEEPSMTQEEYEKRLAEEDPTKPSQVMIEAIREKVKKQKEREERERSRLSSTCSSNTSLMYMRQGSDQSNGSGGIFFGPGGKQFNNMRGPMIPYMHRSSSCSDPYPYMGRPKLHSVSGSDPYYQQSTPRNNPAMYNNFYTMGRGVGNNKKRNNNPNVPIIPSMANNVQAADKLLAKNRSTEIPYFSQQNVYSTSPRKPKPRNANSESLSAHGYDNMPTSQRLSVGSSHKRRVERNSSKRSDDGSEKLNTIEASPTCENGPSTPPAEDPSVGRLGEERSSSSSNGSACSTEVTNVSAISLSSMPNGSANALIPGNHWRLNSVGSNSIHSSSPTPPSLPPRSPTGVLMFETINEQSPFDFSSSAI